MKQNYLFSSWLCDSEMQHTFHFIIWDCFPFVVNQMGFQILAPFEHFLQVSTIFRSTLDKINYVLSSMISKILHLSVCILRVALPVSTVFCRWSIRCFDLSIFLFCFNIVFTLAIFFIVFKSCSNLCFRASNSLYWKFPPAFPFP